MLRVGIVANELSGDILGAGLIREIRKRRSDAEFVGVAGPRMAAQGCRSLVPMERLSVMGLVEVVRHLPELVAIRRRLLRHFLDQRPDVFVGIDAPDFNLGLEARLRARGVPSVHYVSPTVWAWRPGRVKTIVNAVDLMLSTYPFEVDFLRRHAVPVRYVGHPLAEEIPLAVDREAARRSLGLPAARAWIAVLPGSRISEVKRLAHPFIETANWCLQRRPGLRFVAPLVNERVRDLFFRELQRTAPHLPFSLVSGRSREVIALADVVLTASGTATLETLLLKRPMVVAYRLNAVSYHIVKSLQLVKVPFIAMANLLAGEALAPEFLQQRCRADLLGPSLLNFLDDPERVRAIQARYGQIHRELRRDASREAAQAVLGLIGAWRDD